MTSESGCKPKFDPRVCSVDEMKALVRKTLTNCVKGSKGCYLWGGSLRNGYPQMKLGCHFKGRFSTKQPYSMHQVIFQINKRCVLNLAGHEISHLCHNKTCLNPKHLSYEPRHVNMTRDKCKNATCEEGKHVFNMKYYPPCIV